MAQCTAHMQLKSVYGASCHREPGPPISFQRSEGLGSRLPMRTSVYLVRERPHKNSIAPTYLVPVPDTLLHHILCWYQILCCTISCAGTSYIVAPYLVLVPKLIHCCTTGASYISRAGTVPCTIFCAGPTRPLALCDCAHLIVCTLLLTTPLPPQ